MLLESKRYYVLIVTYCSEKRQRKSGKKSSDKCCVSLRFNVVCVFSNLHEICLAPGEKTNSHGWWRDLIFKFCFVNLFYPPTPNKGCLLNSARMLAKICAKLINTGKNTVGTSITKKPEHVLTYIWCILLMFLRHSQRERGWWRTFWRCIEVLKSNPLSELAYKLCNSFIWYAITMLCMKRAYMQR